MFLLGGVLGWVLHMLGKRSITKIVLQITCEFLKDKAKTTRRRVLVGRRKVSKKGEHRVYQVSELPKIHPEETRNTTVPNRKGSGWLSKQLRSSLCRTEI